MAATSMYFGFGAPVPKVGVVGGRGPVVPANIKSGGRTEAARVRRESVSSNPALTRSLNVAFNVASKPQADLSIPHFSYP